MRRQRVNGVADAHRALWIVLAWLALFGVTALSLGPAPPLPSQAPDFSDKLGHAVMYAGLAALFLKAYPRSPPLLIGAALACAGAGIEYLQGLTDYRSASLADALANLCGITLYLSLLTMRRRRHERTRQGTRTTDGSRPDSR